MVRKLTKKEKGFVKDIAAGMNGTKAALKNYNVNNESTAANVGWGNLQKPHIIDAILNIADSIPDELLIEKHTALLEKKDILGGIDVQAVKAGLDMAYKLKGSYAAEKKDITSEGKPIIDIDVMLNKIYGKSSD